MCDTVCPAEASDCSTSEIFPEYSDHRSGATASFQPRLDRSVDSSCFRRPHIPSSAFQPGVSALQKQANVNLDTNYTKKPLKLHSCMREQDTSPGSSDYRTQKRILCSNTHRLALIHLSGTITSRVDLAMLKHHVQEYRSNVRTSQRVVDESRRYIAYRISNPGPHWI